MSVVPWHTDFNESDVSTLKSDYFLATSWIPTRRVLIVGATDLLNSIDSVDSLAVLGSFVISG